MVKIKCKIKCKNCGFLLYDGRVADLGVEVEKDKIVIRCPKCGRILNNSEAWDYLVDAFFGFI